MKLNILNRHFILKSNKLIIMNAEIIRNYCLLKKGTEECFPFDEVTLVFKVMDKIFALMSLDGDLSINLKCDPEKAIDLRENNLAIVPGYHMNKKYWNTIFIDGSLSDKLIFELIDESYLLIINNLSKKQKLQFKSLFFEKI